MQSEALWQAVLQPGPLMSNQVSFAPEDAQIIALLRTLRTAGIADQDLHALCRIHRSDNPSDAAMRLRIVRGSLLSQLHEQQRSLNALDNYIESIEKNNRAQHS